MDIYQIWTTYNKKWSKYEILAFSVLLLLTVIVVAGCVCRKKINIIQAMAIVTMVIFLGIVFGSTVFTRTSTIRQYELIPFWSWKAIFKLKLPMEMNLKWKLICPVLTEWMKVK